MVSLHGGPRGARPPRPGVTRRGAQWSLDGAPAPALAPWAALAALARAAPTPGKARRAGGPGGQGDAGTWPRARWQAPRVFQAPGDPERFSGWGPRRAEPWPLEATPLPVEDIGVTRGLPQSGDPFCGGWEAGRGVAFRGICRVPSPYSIPSPSICSRVSGGGAWLGLGASCSLFVLWGGVWGSPTQWARSTGPAPFLPPTVRAQ